MNDDPSKLSIIADGASAIFDFIVRQSGKRYILSYGDLKDWHKRLFAKVVPLGYYAGNFRGINSARPCLNGEVAVGNNLGSSPEVVEQEMKAFSGELERATKATDEFMERNPAAIAKLQAAVQLAAYAGGSIIKIHPFVNGNGRVARLAMNFFLYRYLGKLPFMLHRPPEVDYAQASEVAMREGNFTPLYQYLLQVIAISGERR